MSLKKKEKKSGVPPFSIHLSLLSGDLLCECISSASFHSSFIAFRFLIKATRAIEELGGPASKAVDCEIHEDSNEDEVREV